jgi:hypothetical protein
MNAPVQPVGQLSLRVDIDLNSDGHFSGNELGMINSLFTPGMSSSFTLPSLSSGDHLVRVVATDSAGNTGIAESVIDVTANPSGGSPLAFVQNIGQTDSSVTYQTTGVDYTAWLTKQGVTWSASTPSGPATFSMNFVGANTNAQVTGVGPSSVTNYFIGDDPSQWYTNAATYSSVQYQGIYQGINLVYSGVQGQLEHEFVVNPGADYHQIQMDFSQYSSAMLNPTTGQLELTTMQGAVTYISPPQFSEMDAAGNVTNLTGGFVMNGMTFGYQVNNYDPTQTLTIDPTLAFSAFVGGTGDDSTSGGGGFGGGGTSGLGTGASLQVDGSGEYVMGTAPNNTFPTGTAGLAGPVAAYQGGNDAVVFHLDTSGNLKWTTFLGGSKTDETANALAIDSSDNVYVTGSLRVMGGNGATNNFPVTSGTMGFGISNNWTRAAWVAEFNSGGSLDWSTEITGNSGKNGIESSGNGIAVDSSGSVYVVGATGTNLITVADDPSTAIAYIKNAPDNNHANAFLVKLTGSTSAQVGAEIYGTYLGGSSGGNNATGSIATSVNVDATGAAYIVGYTDNGSGNGNPVVFPHTIGTYHGNDDIFAVKMNQFASGISYSTLLGGGGDDRAFASFVDGFGDLYIGGSSSSSNMPVTSTAFQKNLLAAQRNSSNTDGWFGFLNTSGSFVAGSYLGTNDSQPFNNFEGTSLDEIHAITVDQFGRIFVAGKTTGPSFPQVNGIDPNDFAGAFFKNAGDIFSSYHTDAFVSAFSADASSLLFSTLLGGENDDEADGIGLDSSGNIYIAGSTVSPLGATNNGKDGGWPGNTVTTSGGLSNEKENSDIFVSRINNPLPPPTTPSGTLVPFTTIFPADQFEPNDTSDTAWDFGTLSGRQTVTSLSLTPAANPDGFPDYDWWKWTAGSDGKVTFVSTVTQGGNQEVSLWELQGNTLVQLADDTTLGVAVHTVSASVTQGEVILVEVKGAELMAGEMDTSQYQFTITLK